MKHLLTICFFLWTSIAFGAKPKHQYVKITTNKGECIIKLYNETPLHRDNFLKLVKDKYYDGTLFHRVIKNFMIQGGDPDSKMAKPEQMLGEGGPKYTIPAEFVDSLLHKKGALAAAREGDNVNPQKASSGSQFYLVQGKTFTDTQLTAMEQRKTNFKYSAAQREIYKTLGGTPHLDQNYTVYGEIVKGIELIDRVASVETGAADRPNEDVKTTITILKKRAAKKLEKELNK